MPTHRFGKHPAKIDRRTFREGATLENLKTLYFFLDQNFDDMSAGCRTDDERQQLRQDYIVARDSFGKARNLIFLEQDPIVASLNAQLETAQQQLNGWLSGLKEITEVLSIATDAVSLAGRLVAIGAVCPTFFVHEGPHTHRP